jgi:GLPGLI family protein
MKMKIYILLSYILLLPTVTWCQEKEKYLEVIYVKAYKNYKNTSNDNPQILKDQEYKLTCSVNESRFEFIPNMGIDLEKANRRFNSKGGGNGVYYKNIEKKLKIHQYDAPFDNKKYLIYMPFNEHEWIITKEKKTINNYLCFKAYTKEEYDFPNPNGKIEKIKNIIVVWFTPEINYSFGPDGFDGLPGLVLEKQLGSFYFIASKISFKKSSIIMPKEGIIISNKEFNIKSDKAFKELLKN